MIDVKLLVIAILGVVGFIEWIKSFDKEKKLKKLYPLFPCVISLFAGAALALLSVSTFVLWKLIAFFVLYWFLITGFAVLGYNSIIKLFTVLIEKIKSSIDKK